MCTPYYPLPQYTCNQVPTPSPNPCMSTQGFGQPDYNPCNYWTYHSNAWFKYEAMGAEWDTEVLLRIEDMAKTFTPTLVRLLQKVYAYSAKHATPIANTMTAQQNTDLTAIKTAIANSFLGIQEREQP